MFYGAPGKLCGDWYPGVLVLLEIELFHMNVKVKVTVSYKGDVCPMTELNGFMQICYVKYRW